MFYADLIILAVIVGGVVVLAVVLRSKAQDRAEAKLATHHPDTEYEAYSLVDSVHMIVGCQRWHEGKRERIVMALIPHALRTFDQEFADRMQDAKVRAVMLNAGS